MELYGFEGRESDRRRAPMPKMQVKQLWQRSHEMINLALQGMTNKDIAKALGVTPQTVTNTLNSEHSKVKLSKMRKERDEKALDVAEEIKLLTEKAVEAYKELFEVPTENLGYKLKKELADTILMDVAGYRAATKIDSRNVNFHLTSEEIEEFKLRGMKTMQRVRDENVISYNQ